MLLLLAIVLVALASRRAEAGIPVYQSGEKAFETGALPPPYDALTKENPTAVAGYKCDIHGIFWSYFSVSNCQPVAFDGHDTEITLDDEVEQAAMVAAIKAKYPESAMKRGIWGHYGWMFLAGVILLGIFFGIRDKLSTKPERDSAAV
jgi:hypothetical protein